MNKDWTKVRDAYLTKSFRSVVDEAITQKVITVEPGDTPPSFHEIRGLGARLYRAAGYSERYVQYLLTHTDPKTSKIYTEGGREALSDKDFTPVKAEIVINR